MSVSDLRAMLLRGHILFFIILATVFGVSVFSGGVGASNKRIITVYADGDKQTVLTEENTVEEAIITADISLNAKDLVEPSRETVINSDVFKINVYRARPYTIVDGSKEIDVLSAYQSPRLIAEDAGVKIYPEDRFEVGLIDDIVAEQMVGQRIEIDRATPVSLVIYGEKTLQRTQAKTVGELLEEKGVELKSGDTVLPKEDAKLTNNLSIHIFNSESMSVVEEPIKFETETIYDNDLAVGESRIEQKGSDGVQLVAYELIIEDGKVVRKIRRQVVVTKQPVKEVKIEGNKTPEGTYTGGPLSQAQITFLGNCESGMTATRNSGNGFYGAYQFMPSTWQAVAPAPYNGVMPHEAPLSAQTQAVQNLLSRSSIYTQFPGCASQMKAQGLL